AAFAYLHLTQLGLAADYGKHGSSFRCVEHGAFRYVENVQPFVGDNPRLDSISVAQARPGFARRFEVDDHVDALLLHAESADLGEPERLNAAYLAGERVAAPALNQHFHAGLYANGVGAQELRDD